MPRTSATMTNHANFTSAGSCVRSRRRLRSNVLIIDRARELFPVKTAQQLAEITGYPPRTVEAWLTGTVKIPTDAFVALLHSDYGRDFIAAVMVDAQPRWWVKLKSYFLAIDAHAAQRIARRKFKEALDADHHLSISAAQMFQDEDFYSSQPSPARILHRPLVRRKT